MVLVCVCAVGGLAALVAPATAMPTPTANVPYLAWLGDDLKLVQCDLQVTYDGEPFPLELENPEDLRVTVDFTVDEWSGDPLGQPAFLGASEAALYQDSDFTETSEYCAAATLTSARPGLAHIGMSVSVTSPSGNYLPEDLAPLALEPDPSRREFLAAWMALQPPVLVNTGGESPGSGLVDLGGPGDSLRATVLGTFPLAGFTGGQATLPTDWTQLATTLAADADNPVPGSDTLLWDVHDDTTPRSGHVLGTGCPPTFVPPIDAVDNCIGGGPEGPFSRIGSDLTATPSWGPFDPMRLAATALGDGKLDAGDAPLPPARVMFQTAPGGFGSLDQVAKAQAYSRDLTGGGAPGNLYAPFYASFVPSTAADPAYASGTTRPGGEEPNPLFSPYTFWERFDVVTRPGSNGCKSPLGTPYPFPNGATTVSVLTDEHGEGRVHFRPGAELILTRDANNRCDLGLIGSESAPATASVIASAHYLQPVLPNPSLVSNTLVLQRRGERGGSSLDCVPKAAFTWACFHRISRPDGQPLQGAVVRATAEPSGVSLVPDSAIVGGFDSRGQTIVGTGPSGNQATLATNAQGTIGFEVRYTLPGPFEVLTEELGTRNPGPGVLRVVTLPPAPPVVDADGDGIHDTVDPSPTTPSSDFSDGAGTSGTIVSTGGLAVTVSDVAGPGVTIATSGSGGPATVTACGGFTVTIAAGSSISITCGSITVAVQSGSATIVLDGGLATVSVPAGAAAQVDQGAGGSYSVQTLTGTVTLTVDGVSTTIVPGPALTVRGWNFDGFFSPVSSPPAVNTANSGQAIPLKWRVTDASGVPVATLSTAKLSVTTRPCALGSTANLAAESTNGGLKHMGGGKYELVWKTPKSYAQSCKVLHLDIGDGVTHTALFDFTK